jgi:serine/threonine protein kinase
MQKPHAGDRIGEYVLIEPVGEGGFGEVWKANHHVWEAELAAVKVPTNPLYVKSLQNEGVTIHGLKHPHIVRAIGLDPYGSPPYLIMEFVEGQSLRQRIERGEIPIDDCVDIFRQMMEGLRFAHENGVVHRDIKPANVLLASDGLVKLTDFGLGRALNITTQSILQSGSLRSDEGTQVAGTLAYMAPEQRDGEATDHRADLYAAAVVLFEMLTGDRPAGSEIPSQVRMGVSGWIDDIFVRCYTRLERRVKSAAEILEAVDRGLSRQRPSGVRPPTAQPSIKGAAKCSSCGQMSEPTDQFCIHCGQQLVGALIRCEKCGSFPDPADKFCVRCGEALESNQAKRA